MLSNSRPYFIFSCSFSVKELMKYSKYPPYVCIIRCSFITKILDVAQLCNKKTCLFKDLSSYFQGIPKPAISFFKRHNIFFLNLLHLFLKDITSFFKRLKSFSSLAGLVIPMVSSSSRKRRSVAVRFVISV